jgi:hypothetical protein
MKRMFPVRGYFVRAKIFGFIMLFLTIFNIIYFLLQFLRGLKGI